MFIQNPITLDWEWLPRSLCFANVAEAEADEGAGGAPAPGASGEGEAEPLPDPEPDPEPAPANDDWRTGLPEDLQDTAGRFNSVEDMTRAIVSFQKREGQVRVPGKDATDEQIAAYHKAIGVPESAEGYSFPELPEEELTDDVKAAQAGWAEVFRAQNITKDQGEALAAAFYDAQAKGIEAQNAADKAFAEEQLSELRTKWPGDEFERNKNLANRAYGQMAERLGLDLEAMGQIELKDGSLLMDRADMMQIFAGFGREMAEGRPDGMLTEGERETAQERLESLREQQREASDKGERGKAQRLYQQELELLKTMGGARGVVGEESRVT